MPWPQKNSYGWGRRTGQAFANNEYGHKYKVTTRNMLRAYGHHMRRTWNRSHEKQWLSEEACVIGGGAYKKTAQRTHDAGRYRKRYCDCVGNCTCAPTCSCTYAGHYSEWCDIHAAFTYQELADAWDQAVG